jgi:hypothetical protein
VQGRGEAGPKVGTRRVPEAQCDVNGDGMAALSSDMASVVSVGHGPACTGPTTHRLSSAV